MGSDGCNRMQLHLGFSSADGQHNCYANWRWFRSEQWGRDVLLSPKISSMEHKQAIETLRMINLLLSLMLWPASLSFNTADPLKSSKSDVFTTLRARKAMGVSDHIMMSMQSFFFHFTRDTNLEWCIGQYFSWLAHYPLFEFLEFVFRDESKATFFKYLVLIPTKEKTIGSGLRMHAISSQMEFAMWQLREMCPKLLFRLIGHKKYPLSPGCVL